MVKAIYTLKNGKSGKTYAKDFEELFQRINLAEVDDIYAVIISAKDIRQGRQME